MDFYLYRIYMYCPNILYLIMPIVAHVSDLAHRALGFDNIECILV